MLLCTLTTWALQLYELLNWKLLLSMLKLHIKSCAENHISLALYSPLLFTIPKQLKCGMCSGRNHAAGKSPGVYFLATARSRTLQSLTKDENIAKKHFIWEIYLIQSKVLCLQRECCKLIDLASDCDGLLIFFSPCLAN